MSRKLLKVAADPAKIAGELRELMPVGDDSDPEEVFAYFDCDKKVRRLTAKYASGWTIRINVDKNGSITSRSAKVKFEAQAKSA